MRVLELLHDVGYVYCNNFALSNIVLNTRHEQASLFSFERCTSYINRETGEHLKNEKLPYFSGDVKFASINQMQMHSSSRRDDLINLLSMLIYFKQMDLPWCDYLFCMPTTSHEQTYNLILEKKQQISLYELAKQCQFSTEFLELVTDIENLEFAETPKYALYNSLLKRTIERAPPNLRRLQWKRQMAHNKYSMIKIISDED